MLKIRMQRVGRINDASFRIVVIEHTESTKSGSFVERVGTYNPRTKQKNLVEDRIKYWLSKGAKASGTVHNMLVSAGIISGKKVNVLPKKTVAKPAPTEASGKEEAAPAAEAAPAPEEAKAEASVEEKAAA